MMKKFAHSVYRRSCEFDDARFRIPGKANAFCLPDKFQNGSGPNSFLVSLYRTTFTWIKRSGRESNNSPVSSAQVMTNNTKFPLVITFAVK